MTDATFEIPSQGLFTPEDLTWRVNREMILLAGGGREMLLQLAYPGAEGTKDPWDRLSKTLDAATRLIFGRPEAARRGAARLEALSGHDPERMMWLWATMVDTSVSVYDRFVEPLTGEQRERYYVEQQRIARACHLEQADLPADVAAFRAYLDTTVETKLESTAAVTTAWQAMQRPPKVPWPLLPMFWPSTLATTALLPDKLREHLDLTFSASMQRTFEASAEVSRRLLRLLPSVAREFPQARNAAARLKSSS